MKLKKLTALAAAMTMAAASLTCINAVPADAAAQTFPDSVTVLLAGSFTGGWSADAANEGNSVTITENGTYKITFDASQVGNQSDGTWALAIKTLDLDIYDYADRNENGDESFEDMVADGGIVFKVDSVKISGEEKLTGESELRSDDDGHNLRVNIYNQWTSPAAAIVDGTQTFDGALEVTFTVDGFKFGEQPLPEYDYKLGDVNGDGNVNANDAALVLMAAAKIGAKKDPGLTEVQVLAANVDRKNDAINANDASFILRYAAYKGAKGTKTIEEYFNITE
ncbi:MAG: hypothetical protein IJ055_07930 [Oscillospiraceae bacterium]|nr:hypothetical protein [Oscillospiraceae bacterium]